MKKFMIILASAAILTSCGGLEELNAPSSQSNLKSAQLSHVWDEAVPLGNGEIGALIWRSGDNLRFSLDRSDLWDLRPISWLEKEEFRFDWVYQKWQENDYGIVQAFFDKGAYSNSIAPSKIPGAALEFSFTDVDQTKRVELDLAQAVCQIEWRNGMNLETFIEADQATGWFRFSQVPEDFKIRLVPPKYESDHDAGMVDEVTGQDLRRLGYQQGTVLSESGQLSYHQVGWGGFSYDVVVNWDQSGDEITGSWSVTSSISEGKGGLAASELVSDDPAEFDHAMNQHVAWWHDYWMQSRVEIPDTLLQKQYDLEMYKFGAAARAHTPPISLQAVWTADNGKMPPWKGDFHHDLNTQLSYWPAYKGNYLDLESGFLNWLWDVKPVAEQYTRDYFGVNGLNVPGVTTLDGKAMGGWIQYSCGFTVSAWLGQHFYLHWRYSMDPDFLKNRAYPWIRDVAIFLDEVSITNADGLRQLPLSSSPEIHNNSREAWFPETTNFDLALIRFTFEKAAELAEELGMEEEAAKWTAILNQWPALCYDDSGLKFAPEEAYNESHRHFSHLVGWHPLGIMDVSDGPQSKEIISNTLSNLETHGSDWWVGYSFSWLGNLYARNFDGEKAVEALTDFAQCFVLPNSFHVNGDQCKSGKSRFTYRPFTLEGNFAFASAIQEMLIQSHTDVIRIFPAVPENWKDVNFYRLRCEGGFLVTAKLENGELAGLKIEATADGHATICLGTDNEPLFDQVMKAGETWQM